MRRKGRTRRPSRRSGRGTGILRGRLARSRGRTAERSGAPPRPAQRRRRAGAGPSAAGAVTLDGGIVASTLLLAGLGVVMVYSTTAPLAAGTALPPHFVRHGAAVLLALLLAFIATRIPLAVWRDLALPMWAGSVALLLATAVLGSSINGAQRWLAVPGLGLSFQPAEPTKLATLLAVAVLLAGHKDRGNPWRRMGMCLALVAPPVALLLAQPDLGNAAVLVAVVGLMLFVAGTPLRLLAAPAAAAALGVGVYIALKPYALARLKGFLDPWRTAREEGFQLVQSFVAFGRGGSLGVGLGDGRQKLFYLPEAHTDFILSVIAEELGLVGVLLVLGAFAALVVAGIRIAGRARDPFALLVAFAMTALLAVPGAVNAAVVMGLLPTTGFTLPLVSFGGTSLLVCALAVGILLRIASREAARPRARVRVRGAAPQGLVRS